MDLEKLAERASSFFEMKQREGREESFYHLKNRHPVWLYEIIRKVHDDGKWLPDDYKYEYVVDAIDKISEGMNPEEPEIEPDVYTSDLIQWLASHGNRTTYVDDAVRDIGWPDEGGIERAIAWGQQREREEVFSIVVAELQKRLEDIEAGEPEAMRQSTGKSPGVFDWDPEG
jgi:hypothetical protein